MVLKVTLNTSFLCIIVLGEKKKSKKTLGDLQSDGDFVLESSEKPVAKLDCSQWPLLLKVCFVFLWFVMPILSVFFP